MKHPEEHPEEHLEEYPEEYPEEHPEEYLKTHQKKHKEKDSELIKQSTRIYPDDLIQLYNQIKQHIYSIGMNHQILNHNQKDQSHQLAVLLYRYIPHNLTDLPISEYISYVDVDMFNDNELDSVQSDEWEKR